jgi:hypothetical protein
MPLISIFSKRSSPIHICVNQPSYAPPSTYFVHQKPMTRLSVGSTIRVFFALVNRSFSVMGHIGKICLVKDGYTIFHLHHSVEDIDFDYLAVPDDWTQLGLLDQLSYQRHQWRTKRHTPTLSLIPTATLQYQLQLPPPMVCVHSSTLFPSHS